MAASVPPNPKLGKSQALNIAQNTVQRLATLVPTMTTDLSPVTVYQPGPAGGTIGGELISTPGAGPSVVSDGYGVWVAPDFYGNGQEYYVQVECFGGGGGAGGGNAAQGGGGGGGGEYACETQYPVKPGNSYAYVVGLPGSGGFNNTTSVFPGAAGTNGGATVFDIAGTGLANGVVANGGGGGDQTSVGIGGAGGSGSTNTIHFNGGNGGTGAGTAGGADNPLALAQISGMFVGNTLSASIIPAWYILNDTGPTGGWINDNSLNQRKGSVTNFTGGLSLATTATPVNVPAYASAADPPDLTNAQAAGLCAEVQLGSLTKPSAQISTSAFAFQGSKMTLSCWVQCAPAGTWSNNVNTATGVIAANCQHYATGTMGAGYALFWYNLGTGSNPNWILYATVSNGSAAYRVSWTQGAPTPGQWLYVVMTYDAGLLTLYVNGAFKQSVTTTGYTSVPGGGYVTRLFMDPNSATNWFFGSVANIWWANDCATTTLITQAYAAGSAATGGSGGGASGGPSAIGGNGSSSSGAIAGAGGVATIIPASLGSTNTPAMSGYAGAAAGAGNKSPSTPPNPSTPLGPGLYGAGGGGSGNMSASPALTTLTVPFSSAATYCGPDATSNPGTPYSVNQQSHPNTGVTTVLFAGGASTDGASGTKNSIMLLPATLKAMLGSGKYTVEQVFLSFTNAMPNAAGESILEVGYSADTVLPQTYSGASLVSYIGAIPLPSGAVTVTYDLTQSGIGALMQSGAATALVLGPGDTPTFDAYNAADGQNFYCSIYGPGAADGFGNSQAPYLTIVLQETMTTQQGSAGAAGAITVTVIDNYSIPISTIEPYQTQDADLNTFAQGYTGQVTAFHPTSPVTTPYTPEIWTVVTSGFMTGGWTLPTPSNSVMPFRYKLLATGQVFIQGEINTGTVTSGIFYTMPSAYTPVYSQFVWCYRSNAADYLSVEIKNNGQVTIAGDGSYTTGTYVFSGIYDLD